MDESTDLDQTPLRQLAALPAPNEPIRLKVGKVVVYFPAEGVRVDAEFEGVLAWRPTPCPRFDVKIRSAPREIARASACALVDVDGTRVECLIANASHSQEAGEERVLRCQLRLRGTTDFGDGTRMRRATFGLVNFESYIGTFLVEKGGGWAGRLVLEAAGWRCVLDARRDLGDVVNQLHLDGGFAITHAGTLERSDAGTFGVSDMDAVLDALFVLFSFARGHSISFVQLVGEDDSGERRWWRWHVPSVDPWSDPVTWFDNQRPEQLEGMFETLVTRSTDVGWRNSLQLAVYWYVLASQNRSTSDTAIVLAFTGLDLVGWFWLVELAGQYSAAAFDKLDGAERLRRLMTHMSVDLRIPAGLPNLAAHASSEAWADGPAALAVLRNSAVHPKRRARVFDAPDPVRWEACTLAAWYLELGLLALLGHKGVYINRVEHLTNHGLVYVPWATVDEEQ